MLTNKEILSVGLFSVLSHKKKYDNKKLQHLEEVRKGEKDKGSTKCCSWVDESVFQEPISWESLCLLC